VESPVHGADRNTQRGCNLFDAGRLSLLVVHCAPIVDDGIYPAGGIVNQWPDSGSGASNEYWNVIPVGKGTFRIVNVNSGLDLEIDGTIGRTNQWGDISGAKNEHWGFDDALIVRVIGNR
jgi:hypothetical protein